MTIETKANLQHMGQWVFKDAPEWVESAAVDKNGHGYRYGGPLGALFVEQDAWINEHCQAVERIDGIFDAANWQHSAIARDQSSPSIEVTEWKKQALANYEQYDLAKMAITNLRAVVVELAETLHAADGNARISMTSSELLELLHSNEDDLDTAF